MPILSGVRAFTRRIQQVIVVYLLRGRLFSVGIRLSRRVAMRPCPVQPSSDSASILPQDEYAAARNYLDQLFDNSKSEASCVSVDRHDLKHVSDLQAHFFGCLNIKKRVEVLDNADHPIWEQAKKLELEDTKLHVQSPSTVSPDIG